MNANGCCSSFWIVEILYCSVFPLCCLCSVPVSSAIKRAVCSFCLYSLNKTTGVTSVGSWELLSLLWNNHHCRWKSFWHSTDRNVHAQDNGIKFYSRCVYSHWQTYFLTLWLSLLGVLTTGDHIKCTVTLNKFRILLRLNSVGKIWDI